MNMERLNKFLSGQTRAHYVAMLTGYFALIYHVFILWFFACLKINFMVYFNIVSVSIFFVLSILITCKKWNFFSYIVAAAEVIIHQTLASYYLGSEAGFQYFILLMGFLPFLLFANRLKVVLPFAIFCSVIFYAFTTSDLFVVPAHLKTIDANEVIQLGNAIKLIKAVNIGLTTVVILVVIFIFAYAAYQSEKNLQKQVENQLEILQSQNSKIIEIQNNTIISLSNLVENRDSDTGHHILRTREYVRLLARKAKEAGLYPETLTEYYIELLIKSAPMHDIGKIVVPDSILKKEGKLTPEEFEQIKRHTTEGGKIIRDVLVNSGDEDYIRIATEVAEGHHEKWNGSGYPYGLKEYDIPLSARIMALADVFDALVSPRCYKKPFTIDKAIQIIKESSGSHFDPKLAEVFMANRELLEQISIEYKD